MKKTGLSRVRGKPYKTNTFSCITVLSKIRNPVYNQCIKKEVNKMRYWKRTLPLLLAAALTAGTIPAQAAGLLTRGEAAEMLRAAADDYNPGVQQSDILKGHANGDLDLDGPVTRAEALIMLNRAFNGLPESTGDNARMAIPAEDFTDIPDWASDILSDVFSAGIAAGTGDGLFSPDAPLSADDLDTLIHRVYALEGANLKDDFYAAVNKDWLDSSTIPAGLSVNGALYGLNRSVNDQIAALIREIDAQPQQPGTAEAKIKALYDCVMDAEAREKAGIAPLQTYLDAIENAKTLDELIDADCLMRTELGSAMLLDFGLMTDQADSSRYIVRFLTLSPSMEKEFYTKGTQAQKNAYTTYFSTLLALSGLSREQAEACTARIYEAEKAISAVSLNPQDSYDVDKTYNLFPLAELQAMFPQVDLNRVYTASGLTPTDRILIMDVEAVKAAAKLFDEEHLDTLKAVARLGLVSAYGTTLNQDFLEANFDFSEAYYGVNARQSSEEIAAQQVQSLLADYLSRAYSETYFSPEAKADVEKMIREFISIYQERIRAQDWMSSATREKAIRKLNTMGVKVGYPDSWDTYLDAVRIQSPAEGGSFFSNTVAIRRAVAAELRSRQNKPVDKTEWIMSPFTVNACYNPSANDITFPAAFLQAPLYDIDASREENLGGIGYIIAHEITHAFDNNGAKYDAHGNAADWWAESDYAAFQQKCQDVIDWYDGQEAYPGIACKGALTISENVADLGAIGCVVAAAQKTGTPDYDALFRAVANCWASTSSRQMREYLAVADVHAPDKLRCNRVLQTLPEFYETYDIRPGDGMWTDPASRVSIW